MPSKVKIWDFLENDVELSKLSSSSIGLIYCHDNFLEKLIVDRLSELETFQKLFGHDLRTHDIESKFFTLDLFATEKKFIVFNTEFVDKNGKDYLLRDDLNYEGVQVIYLFSKKNELYKKLSKDKNICSYEIAETPFWEFERLLTFLSKSKGIFFDHKSIQLIISSLNPDVKSYLSFINKLNSFFPGGKPNFDQVKSVIINNRLDQFEFAKLLSKKDLKTFYSKLSSKNVQVEDLKSSLAFFNSHLKKLFNPGYAQAKARLSKYDKEILSHYKLWEGRELLSEMKFLSELDHTLKTRADQAKSMIKERYLKFFT